MTATESLGIAVLRVVLGIIFVLHGYLTLVIIGPAAMSGYTTAMGYPAILAPVLAWYLFVAHLGGGVLLVVGLFTRWAALAQLPIMGSALFLYHIRQGFFLNGIILDASAGRAIAGGYEYVLLVMAATLALLLTGGGALALDRARRRE